MRAPTQRKERLMNPSYPESWRNDDKVSEWRKDLYLVAGSLIILFLIFAPSYLHWGQVKRFAAGHVPLLAHVGMIGISITSCSWHQITWRDAIELVMAVTALAILLMIIGGTVLFGAPPPFH